MKKMIIGAAVSAAALAALRRFGPAIHERGMKKCHEMMNRCQEMAARQAGPPPNTCCMSAATPDPEQAAARERERAEATPAT